MQMSRDLRRKHLHQVVIFILTKDSINLIHPKENICWLMINSIPYSRVGSGWYRRPVRQIKMLRNA
jgi:hypothetical protein